MRRFLILLLALATALLVASPATAKKPDNPGKPDTEPVGATTCVSPWWNGDVHDSDDDGWSDDFTIFLDAENQDACVDVLTQFAGVWHITVEVLAGNAPRSMTIVPRDAVAPGDSCGGEMRRGGAVTDLWILPHPDDPRGFTEIPAATVNACPGNDEGGVGEFEETVERAKSIIGGVQYSSGDVFETEVLMAATGEVHPLGLLVFTRLGKSDLIAIHVDLPPLELPQP